MTEAPVDLVCLGEPLLEFVQPSPPDPLSGSPVSGEPRVFWQGFGGDTSNTAIAAARQGLRVGYVTAVGDDPFGRLLLDLWQQEGVDASRVRVTADASTGIYFISYENGSHVFSYHRAGSAASRMSAEDLPADYIAKARALHVSGISQAISDTACDAVFAAMRMARSGGTLVSYDPNLRLMLWPLGRARAVIHAAMQLCDVALPGLDDARQLTGLHSPEDIADFYLSLGARIVALTLGAGGTLVATAVEKRLIPGWPVDAIDATGAGDCFDGVFLAQLLEGKDPFAAAFHANAAAALSTQGRGAVDALPRSAEITAFLKGRPLS
jgi:2-dehydro-3-deoxygluconokinase